MPEKRFVALGVAGVFAVVSFYAVRANKQMNIDAIRVGPAKDIERMKMKLKQREIEKHQAGLAQQAAGVGSGKLVSNN